MAGVVFVNPSSGSKETSAHELRAHLVGHRVEECEPSELGQRIAAAVEEGVDFIGVAGGDGTVRLAAERLLGHDVPLLVIPAGTRNHFARDLGIGDLEGVRAAAGGTNRRRISVGQVNDRCFVNNSSIGLYPKIVIRREARQGSLPKGLATVVAAYEQLRHGRRFAVAVDGQPRMAWMVFVGNGCYGEGVWDLADRETLDEAVLDVRVVRADRPWAGLRVVVALLLGRLTRSPLVERHVGRALRLESSTTRLHVALDGEVEQLASPLDYRALPDALTVLVPPSGRDQERPVGPTSRRR